MQYSLPFSEAVSEMQSAEEVERIDATGFAFRPAWHDRLDFRAAFRGSEICT